MAGETSFLSNDYIQAASAFGSNLGSTVLGALSNMGSNVINTANQSGDYLSSTLNQQTEDKKTSNVKDIRATVNNGNTISPASIASMGSTLNLNGLTNGLSTLSVPNVMNTAGSVGSTLASNLTFGASNLVTNNNIINPTVTNSGTVSNTVDNSNVMAQMVNPSLPIITDANKMMTPLSEAAASTFLLSDKSSPISQVNSAVFDSTGNLVKYTGGGAKQLIDDISGISSGTGKTVANTSESAMSGLSEAGSQAGGVAKTLLWDAPYAAGGYTGEVVEKAGKVTRSQIDNMITSAPDLVVNKIFNNDGTTTISWKQQSKPENIKTYPKEKEAELFDKGDKYITEGISDNLKYKSYKMSHGKGSDKDEQEVTHIPGQSQMMIKGLSLENTQYEPKSDKEVTHIDISKIGNSVNGNGGIINDKLGNITNGKSDEVSSKYYFSQMREGDREIDNEELKDKNKKKSSITNGQVFRKKNRFIPRVMIIKPPRTNSIINTPVIYKPKRKSKPIQTTNKIDHPKLMTNANFVKSMNKITGSVNMIDSVVTLGSSNKTNIIHGTPSKTSSFNAINMDKQIITNSGFDFNMNKLSINMPKIDIGIKKKSKK